MNRITAPALIGIAIILVCVGGVALAPWLAPHDPNVSMGARWASPSPEHWLGLDQIGRDMFARILLAGRVSIGLPLLATILAFAIGIATGLFATMAGGWVDALLSRAADIILSIPILISALIVFTRFGTSAMVLVLTIGLLYSVLVFRAVRAIASSIATLGYVEAARLRGESTAWVLVREILPNAYPTLAAEFGRRFCFAFLFVAALSFLGLGVLPPDVDWGSMVKDSALAIPAGIAAPLYPAAAIALLTVGINLVVDWLRGLQAHPQAENA